MTENLNQLDDTALVSKVKNGENDALEILIHRNSGICLAVCNKLLPFSNITNVSNFDVTSDKDYLIYKSAKNFKPEKGIKFSTYVGNVTKWHCLNQINATNDYICVEPEKISQIIEEGGEDHKSEKKRKTAEQIDYVRSLVDQITDKRIKRVFERRYFSGDKLVRFSKIAKELGVSNQTVINWHNKYKNIFRNKIESTNDRI